MSFLSITQISSYAKENDSVRIYVDGHTDFINSARNWISKNILHKIIYKWCAKEIEPFTTKFYGTLPLRVDFFKNVYNIPSNKTDLLLMGVDDTEVDFENRRKIRNVIREELDLKTSDFVIVTGGKIDKRKNIHLLMQAVIHLNIKNIKLIVFGLPNSDMEDEINELIKSNLIKFIGWIPSRKSFEYFFAADIACFPGTHSVLWEEAVGLGLPYVFKRWDGIDHIDLNGNCLLIDSVNVVELQKAILRIYENKELFENMEEIALDKGIKKFSYYETAKQAIEL